MWNHAVFSKNREQLLNEEVAQIFFASVNKLAPSFMSGEHLHRRWKVDRSKARTEGLLRKAGTGQEDREKLHGEKRTNETH